MPELRDLAVAVCIHALTALVAGRRLMDVRLLKSARTPHVIAIDRSGYPPSPRVAKANQ